MQVESTTSNLNDLKNQITVSEAEIKGLTIQVGELETVNKIIESHLTSSLAENKDLTAHLSDFTENVSQLSIAVEKKDDQINQMTSLIQNLSEGKKDLQVKIKHQVLKMYDVFHFAWVCMVEEFLNLYSMCMKTFVKLFEEL